MKQNDLKIMGLYGDGLISIDEPELVRRYNDCLRDIGLSITRKRKFHIDCIGWSPELADIFGEYYLCKGEANPFAIIITPKQRHAPIYRPSHSFDWALMKSWFDANLAQITEVTKYSGIWLDIDQEVESYQEPTDLLMVDDVIVRAKTPSNFMRKVKSQNQLIEKFMQETDVFALSNIGEEIVGSAKEIGDMRNKQAVIDNFHFTDICTFYTRAFGGTFVFCRAQSVSNGDEYYVLNKNTAKRAQGVNSVIDRRILSKLEEMGLISYDLEWWKNQFYRLKIIRDSFLFDVLDDVFPDMNFLELNTARQKGIIEQITELLPVEYFELKRIIHMLEKDKTPADISHRILPFFAHPSADVEHSAAEVIWHALALVCDKRQVVRLFRQDKDEFYAAYENWKTPKRTWAISVVTKYYQHRMMINT